MYGCALFSLSLSLSSKHDATPRCRLSVILAALAITSLSQYNINTRYDCMSVSLAHSLSERSRGNLCFFFFRSFHINQIHKLQFIQLLLTKLTTKMVILDQLNAQSLVHLCVQHDHNVNRNEINFIQMLHV